MWQKLVKLLDGLMPELIKKYLTAFVLRTLGLAGGFWAFMIATILKIVWWCFKDDAERAAEIQDQKKVDEENLEKKEQDVKNGAPIEEIIKDETDILNGRKRP